MREAVGRGLDGDPVCRAGRSCHPPGEKIQWRSAMSAMGTSFLGFRATQKTSMADSEAGSRFQGRWGCSEVDYCFFDLRRLSKPLRPMALTRLHMVRNLIHDHAEKYRRCNGPK